jgi:adenine-specific DNA-methyltransferase
MLEIKNGEIVKKIGKSENYLFKCDNIDFFKNFNDQLKSQIDIISIDPPYNTGKKVGKYTDSFTSITKWLDFLKPRLEFSKDILSDSGLIFININEKNSPYLRVMCDEIFDIKNYVSTIIWQNKYTVSNDKKGITCQTENILVYAKNIDKIIINNDTLDPEYVRKQYRNWDNDIRGPWRKGVQLYKKKTSKTYTVTSPTGKQWTKGWNYSEDEWYNNLVKNNLLYWGDGGNSCPTKKTFLSDSKGKGIRNLWLGEEVGYTQTGTKDLEDIMNIEASFLYPKPVKLMKRILKIASKPDSVVLDYFAGSGTLGQAVIEYNKENNTNIRFILVTNNENDICDSITYVRMKKCIDDSGICYVNLIEK